MKNVQLSMELFYSLLQYHLMENQDSEIKRKIKRELEAKLEKLEGLKAFKKKAIEFLGIQGLTEEFREFLHPKKES